MAVVPASAQSVGSPVIHYHGVPITPEHAAVPILTGRHALVSFAYPSQITLVAAICQSFVLDCGAFTLWKQGKSICDWSPYYEFVRDWQTHPACEWAIIPDVIDGTEEDNDALLEEWPLTSGVPVWHLAETLERLERLARRFPRVALGSTPQFGQIGSAAWHQRMSAVMETVAVVGRPITKLHGLRMLNPKVFTKYPFASADSSNIARNIGLDTHWKTGRYLPPSKAARGVVMAARIEHYQSADRWIAPAADVDVNKDAEQQQDLFEGAAGDQQ